MVGPYLGFYSLISGETIFCWVKHGTGAKRSALQGKGAHYGGKMKRLNKECYGIEIAKKRRRLDKTNQASKDIGSYSFPLRRGLFCF
jgi:hypothetical protein